MIKEVELVIKHVDGTERRIILYRLHKKYRKPATEVTFTFSKPKEQ